MVETIQFRGAPVPSEGKPFEITQNNFTLPSIKPDEYLVKVTHSGLCGSDLMMTRLGAVLGHEGVGTIVECGTSATLYKPGDVVGWGPMSSTCGSCDPCMLGKDAYCLHPSQYGSHGHDTHGSLCSYAVRKEQWLFGIPKGMSGEDAAPLMCAGGTVWTALVTYCKPYDRVGIVSLGGLGHLAVQFAAKMGCEVVVFSSNPTKRSEALSFNASEFYAINGGTSDLSLAGLGMEKPIDRLILTSPNGITGEGGGSLSEKLGMFYGILSMNSTIIPLYVDQGQMTMPCFPTMMRGMQIVGSCICSRFMQKKMIEFAARHKIHCVVEKFPMTVDGITEAIKRMQEGKIRYRGIIAWEYN
ncbi:GroES-like protein [Dendrothele bispora CBS 962.96]|uniref:GroES-like protein n=1 Tax=Dendrothele bispora (strain CBS 962.96) TaxID=1314807 RepID=A0A4S8M7V2_DENBC|nr:GroES-like protein [Dendrothele bispora CBS 962.96]